ncbi:hypothetical protein [Scytonema sp. NUACC26]|uniref:hypothetical protein n=1 Tax=Scytonema sp. NUACC26 TaxID=3140176 RepID=UPI0034DBCCB5
MTVTFKPLINQLFAFEQKYQQSESDDIYGYTEVVLTQKIDRYEVGDYFEYVEINFSTSELLIYDVQGEVESRHNLVITIGETLCQ